MTEPRAVRDFPVSADPWPVVDGWAAHRGYHILQQAGDHRLYKKGTGLLTGARVLDITKADGTVHLEAWVKAMGAARVMTLFILPKEITIESGGMKAAVPRKQGRNEVNELLQQLGQQPIA